MSSDSTCPVLAKVPQSSSGFSLELPQSRRRPEQGHEIRPASHYGIDEVVEDGADDMSAKSPTAETAASPGKPQAVRRFSGVPDPRLPPTVVESGIAHDLIHVNCTPIPGVAASGDRLVATLFYRYHGPHHRASTATLPASNASVKGLAFPAGLKATGGGAGAKEEAVVDGSEEGEFPSNLAPTAAANDFPMEPPEDPEPPRDGLYGAYVSPICIAAFLHLMSTFPHQSAADADSDGSGTSTSENASPRAPYSSGYGFDLKASHRHLDSATQPRVVELILSPAPALDLADLRRHEQLYRFEREWNVEVVLQRDSLWRRHPRLVVFDMDSTLITQEVIDMLAEAVTPDVAARVAEITHRAMAGELQFEDAFRERVRLLTGLPATLFDTLRPRLNVTEGVPALVRALRRLGVKTAVLSGGFQPLTGWLAAHLGINHAHANHVVIDDDNKLTGVVTGAIVGRERKCALLKEIAAQEGVDLRQVVAVGDGANDLLMLETAGLGVAWHAKPVVQLEADARLNGTTLLDLLYLFGFTSTEIAELAAEEAIPLPK